MIFVKIATVLCGDFIIQLCKKTYLGAGKIHGEDKADIDVLGRETT